MKAREAIRRRLQRGCVEVRRGKGSHIRMRCPCGKHHTTVPDHRGEDSKLGTVRGIESATAKAVWVMVKQMHSSVRDTGALLDLSHQRVQQILKERERADA